MTFIMLRLIFVFYLCFTYKIYLKPHMKSKNANNEIIYLDLFSGVGGFPKGFEDANFKPDYHYFSEIDKHAIAVYKYKFKNSIYVGSVTIVSGIELRKKHPNARFIVTFGFPCQDLSIAGEGKGFDGTRSVLFFEAIRIVKEVRAEVFIFENVKGLLSHNDYKTFETVLRTIADIGLYECEWQLVNTAWIIPQNRERIYFIGHLTGRSKPRVFPFRKGDREFNISQEEAPRNGERIRGRYSRTISARYYKDGSECLIKQVNPSKESGGAQPYQQNRIYSSDGHIPALNAELSGRNNIEVKPVLTPDRKEKRQNGRRFKEDGEPAFTLNCQDQHGVMITGVSMERTEQGKKLRKQYENGEINHGFNEHRQPRPRPDGNANTLDTVQKSQMIFDNTAIRRLTEIECERLQGFPDNWTKYGDYDGEIKEVSKTQRYKQMGNAVSTVWPRMIAERLFKTENE